MATKPQSMRLSQDSGDGSLPMAVPGRKQRRGKAGEAVQVTISAMSPSAIVECKSIGCQWAGERRGLNAHWRENHQ